MALFLGIWFYTLLHAGLKIPTEMSINKDINLHPQKRKIKGQYFGLIVGLIISVFIIQQEIFRINGLNRQKDEVSVNENPEADFLKDSSLSSENKYEECSKSKYIDKFPQISGLAKMLIVTIHAPWIFNNREVEQNNEEEAEFNYSFNSFFSKFSFPILKERSELEEPDQVPIS